MKYGIKLIICMIALLGFTNHSAAQVDEDQLGAWYMYFWSVSQDKAADQGKWGLQGDV